MRKTILHIFILLTLVSCDNNSNKNEKGNFRITSDSKIDYEFAENYITQSANDWAQAIAEGDTATINRIMANDFVGVSSRGELYDKKTLIQESIESANLFKPNVYNVSIRFSRVWLSSDIENGVYEVCYRI
jgi:hypothetical protein